MIVCVALTVIPFPLQGVESHLIHMKEEMNKRYKEHNYLLEAMVIIYEWFFKREVRILVKLIIFVVGLEAENPAFAVEVGTGRVMANVNSPPLDDREHVLA